jgi:hypothetical protein
MKHAVFHAPAKMRPSDLLRKMFLPKGKGKNKLLGSGAYATAHWVPSLNRVVKLGELSDPYLDYVRTIKRSRTPSPFFPKIDEVIECHESGADWDDQDGCYAVVMERLYDSSKAQFEVMREIVCSTYDGDSGELDAREVVDLFLNKKIDTKVLKAALKAARHVERLCESVGADMDMHTGNILFRKTGNLSSPIRSARTRS